MRGYVRFLFFCFLNWCNVDDCYVSIVKLVPKYNLQAILFWNRKQQSQVSLIPQPIHQFIIQNIQQEENGNFHFILTLSHWSFHFLNLTGEHVKEFFCLVTKRNLKSHYWILVMEKNISGLWWESWELTKKYFIAADRIMLWKKSVVWIAHSSTICIRGSFKVTLSTFHFLILLTNTWKCFIPYFVNAIRWN